MLVQEATTLIQRISKKAIKELLFHYINPEAHNLGTLFNLQNENNDPSTKLIRELIKLPIGTSVITIALTLGSKKLYDELRNVLLRSNPDEMITLLQLPNASIHSLADPFKASHMDKIFTYHALRLLITQNSDDRGVALIEAIGKQSAEQIYNSFCYLLLNSQALTSAGNSSLDSIGFCLTPSLINTLNSVNSNLVADLFKINRISSAKAFALLRILTKLCKEKLMSLFIDPNISATGYVTSPTIMHIIFEKYPLEVIKQCFVLLNSFSSEELELFFPSLKENLKTPLHYLFARNEDGLTDEFIQWIRSKPHLKKLLLKCRWHAVDNSPMHEAAQNGNIIAIQYLLKQETINPKILKTLRKKAMEYHRHQVVQLIDALGH